MRITSNVLMNNLKRNLYNNIRNLDKTQEQLASGKRINRISDDPAGLVDTLRLSGRIRESRQYQSNVQDGASWLQTTDDALNSLTGVLNRIYELTIYGANGTLDAESRKALAHEVKQLQGEVETIANTSHGDRYIFGGTNTLQQPLAGGVWQANNTAIEYEIGPGIKVPINSVAQDIFIEKDMMTVVDDIYNHLMSSDTASLGGDDLNKIKENLDQVLSARAQIGARVNRMEMAENRLLEAEINLITLQSDVEGIDPAKAILDLKNQENVYRTSLSVGARVIQPTLLDFLR